jgi:hypothetical protein
LFPFCFAFCNIEPNQSDAFVQLVMSQSVIYPTLLDPSITGSCHQLDKRTVQQHTTYLFHIICISIGMTQIFIIFVTALSSHLLRDPQNLSTQNIR